MPPASEFIGQAVDLERAFAIAVEGGYRSQQESFRKLLSKKKTWQSRDGRIEITYGKRQDGLNYSLAEILD